MFHGAAFQLLNIVLYRLYRGGEFAARSCDFFISEGLSLKLVVFMMEIISTDIKVSI